jgi:hypothetical protein
LSLHPLRIFSLCVYYSVLALLFLRVRVYCCFYFNKNYLFH